jgi:Immunity protein 53
MEPYEVDQRWMAREPVDGVAFLLNDSVQVVAGPHCGARGAVVSLIETSPQPIYLVELGNGIEARMQQADIVTATADDPAAALTRLQRWYSSQCDGDWEHQLGIEIGTLDNPGWLVKIDLRGTPLETRDFAVIEDVEDEREWIDCRIQDGAFRGAGGPHMLGAIIEVFVRWAEAG